MYTSTHALLGNKSGDPCYDAGVNQFVSEAPHLVSLYLTQNVPSMMKSERCRLMSDDHVPGILINIVYQTNGEFSS